MEINELTKQQEEDLDEFDKNHRHDYVKGKVLVYIIAGVYLLMLIASFILSGHIRMFKILFNIACMVALIKGVTLARYLYIAAGVISVIESIYILPEMLEYSGIVFDSPIYLIIYLLYWFGLVFAILSVILLKFNKDIKEYMYMERY